MEIIIAFVWGAVTVFYVGMAVVVVQMRKQVKEVEKQIKDMNGMIDHSFLQIQNEKSDLTDYVDKLYQLSEDNVNELYRYIDSRLDKLHGQFSSNIASGVEVRKSLDEINKLKEKLDKFIVTYQNQ